jgi:hypothetical protein
MGKQYLGLGVETTVGTAVAPTRYLEALTESIQLEQNYDRIETLRSFSTQQVVLLNRAVKGDSEILANYNGIGMLYKYLLGSVDTATGSVNTHTFPSSAGIPSTDRIGSALTVCVRRGAALFWKYAGMKPVSLAHGFGTDQASRMTWGWLGQSAAFSTTGSDATSGSYPTLLPMSPSHASVSFDGAALVARNVQINVENPLDEFYVLGTVDLGAEPDRNAVLKVTGTAEVAFSNTTQYDKFTAGSDVDVTVLSTNGTQSVRYNLDKCRITQATPHLNGRQRLIATYQFEAYYNSDATENFQVVLVNSDATP